MRSAAQVRAAKGGVGTPLVLRQGGRGPLLVFWKGGGVPPLKVWTGSYPPSRDGPDIRLFR